LTDIEILRIFAVSRLFTVVEPSTINISLCQKLIINHYLYDLSEKSNGQGVRFTVIVAD